MKLTPKQKEVAADKSLYEELWEKHHPAEAAAIADGDKSAKEKAAREAI